MAIGGMSERLAFILEMDPSRAIAGMRQVGTEADRSLGKVDDRLNRIGGRMQVAGAGAVAFAGVAGAALIGFAQASEEAEAAQRRLTNSIQNSPALAGESAEAFTELATAIQGKTAADGDAIVSGMALAGQLGVTGEELRELSPLAVDLAQKMGIDMDAAFRAVARAVEGNTGQLERMIGPMADGETAMEALRRSVGGYAEQEGATFSGQLERLKNQLGDVVEGIGGGVVGAFNDMLGPVTAGAEAFTKLDAGTQETIGTFAAYGTAAVGLAGASSFAIGSIIKMVDNFRAAREAVSGFVGSGGLGRLATVAVPAVGALALFGAALQNQAQDAAAAEARVDSLASSIRETGSVAEATTAQFERGELFEGLNMSASEMTATLADIGVELSDLQAGWDDNAATVSTVQEAMRAARAEGTLTLEQYDALSNAIFTLTGRVSAAKDESVAQSEVLGEVGEATGAAADGTDEFTAATETNTAAIEENTAKITERNDAVAGLLGQELSMADAMLATEREIATYNETMANAEATTNDRTQAGVDLLQQFLSEADVARETAEAQATAAGRSETAVREGVDAQVASLVRLAQNLEPGSHLRQQIEGHIWALAQIPRDIQTRMSVAINPSFGRGTEALPTLGKFHTGGVVPGIPGTDVPILARAGERVVPAGTTPTGGADGLLTDAELKRQSAELREQTDLLRSIARRRAASGRGGW